MPKIFDTPEAYRDWNDEMIRRYQPDAYYENRLIRILEGFRLRTILKLLENLPSRGTFLEVGCGFGFVLQRIACARVFRGGCYGLDLSLPSLKHAAAQTGIEGGLVQGDGTRLPFRKGAFDAVLLTEVIEHVPDPVGILRACSEILAPGGRLIVTAPNEAWINRLKGLLRSVGLWRLIFGRYQATQDMTDEWHIHEVDPEMLRRWVTDAGLRITRKRALPFPGLPLRILVAACPRRDSSP